MCLAADFLQFTTDTQVHASIYASFISVKFINAYNVFAVGTKRLLVRFFNSALDDVPDNSGRSHTRIRHGIIPDTVYQYH